MKLTDKTQPTEQNIQNEALQPQFPLIDYPSKWQELMRHFKTMRDQSIHQWFSTDPNRANNFTYSAAGITIDFSKNFINEETVKLLTALADESQLALQRDRMFKGEQINSTEKRAALHTLLRSKTIIDTIKNKNPSVIQSKNLNKNLKEESELAKKIFQKMRHFSENVRNGNHKGFTGKSIRQIVNIGIGGSDLGPKMVINALDGYIYSTGQAILNIDFISNVDGYEVERVFRKCDPETTLFIIVSKTFTTQETLSNAKTIKKWLLDSGCPENKLGNHFVAVSTNTEEPKKFGILPENIFEMWDWIGGRYSLWSAVGLSIMLAMGHDAFGDMLDGAREMDEHFLSAPWSKNLPVLLALIGIWYRNFYLCETLLIAPYFESLHYLPSYLQQLEMESNGKSTNVSGKRINYPTSPVLWGETGTNSQHAFFQMLHQGSTLVPIDFIAVLKPHHQFIEHHRQLLANCFAQSEALMIGRNEKDTIKLSKTEEAVKHMKFDGNKPSNTILLEKCDPKSLGALIALYEHKVFTQATIWKINPFDQFGVELGKQLGRVVESELRMLDSKQFLGCHDSSTNSLITFARRALKQLISNH